MKQISFVVPGQPVAKGRARTSAHGGHFTPKKTRVYENQVAAYASEAMYGKLPWGGPIEVSIEAYMMIPSSWGFKKRLTAIAGQIQPIVRPDLDNIEKSALDGINKIVFVDDCQVTKVTKFKAYAENPRLCITVTGRE